ncbi:hypothetical protein F4779DRAFT_282198 [Xylariaceae sp. FL0662B]|nr:hypothetical protein F4779DRAFT_282198 [Xylariaceae sp. FL0662B]
MVPTDPGEFRHLRMVTAQLISTEFKPISFRNYSTLLNLLKNIHCLDILSSETRGAFTTYNDLNPTALASLEYFIACLGESIRLSLYNNTGLPRLSPGPVVEGVYAPQRGSLDNIFCLPVPLLLLTRLLLCGYMPPVCYQTDGIIG